MYVVVFLVCLLLPPSAACIVWTEYSLWREEPLTNCVWPAERRRHDCHNNVLFFNLLKVVGLWTNLLPHRLSFWRPWPAPRHCPDLKELALASRSPDGANWLKWLNTWQDWSNISRGVLKGSYVIGSINVTSVILIKERHQIQKQVEGAVNRLLPRYTISPIPVLTIKTKIVHSTFAKTKQSKLNDEEVETFTVRR